MQCIGTQANAAKRISGSPPLRVNSLRIAELSIADSGNRKLESHFFSRRKAHALS
jgi:hypothetical protein